MVGINGVSHWTIPSVWLYTTNHSASISKVLATEKNEPSIIGIKVNMIPYDMINAITEKPKNSNDEPE